MLLSLCSGKRRGGGDEAAMSCGELKEAGGAEVELLRDPRRFRSHVISRVVGVSLSSSSSLYHFITPLQLHHFTASASRLTFSFQRVFAIHYEKSS